MKPKSSQPAPEPEINVTPLVDVVLVLLIIFMVIAPNLQSGVPVELPELAAVDKTTREQAIEVVVDRDQALFLDDSRITREALLATLEHAAAQKTPKPVVIKADARLEYGVVRALFADVQRVGVRSVSMKVTSRKAEG